MDRANTLERFATCRYLFAISLRENKSSICKSFASVYDGVMIRGRGRNRYSQSGEVK